MNRHDKTIRQARARYLHLVRKVFPDWTRKKIQDWQQRKIGRRYRSNWAIKEYLRALSSLHAEVRARERRNKERLEEQGLMFDREEEDAEPVDQDE